jgi:putative heme-binding domain-containing protein
MCVRKSDPNKKQIVLDLINDKSPYVRRIAAETCLRLEITPDFNALTPMLTSENRIEALAARRLLERIPADQWQANIFSTDNKQLFLNGSVAMMTSEPSLDRAYQILAKSSEFMEGFLNDREFTDLLRTVQLALVRGQVDPARIPGLTLRMASEFPSTSSPINRELARILGYLKAGDFSGRLDEYLASEETSVADKVHVAMHLLAAKENLNDAERVAVVDALETSRFAKSAGGSYDQYLQKAIAKISSEVAGNDVHLVLANGHRWPKTTLAAFYKMPEKIDAKTVDAVIAMDRRILEQGTGGQPQVADHSFKQVRLGVIAILARDGSEAGMEYLRSLWQQEPKRRSDIVIGLAQQPEGENWAYMVGSLPQLDDLTGAEVLQQLLKVNQRPQDAKHYREVIQLGNRLRGNGAELASQVLSHWSGDSNSPEGDWKDKMAAWSQWYETKFPEATQFETALNQTAQNTNDIAGTLASQISTAKIMDQIEAEGLGSAQRGHAVFAKAQCATCHRLGSQGQGVGPDLTNLAARFSMRETVESMVHPAAVIPDRYRSKIIQTVDGMTLEGMTVKQDDGSFLVLTSEGKRIQVPADDVQAMAESKKSAMPAGLLNDLTSTEVADLMAFLMESSKSQVAEQTKQPTARISAMPMVKEIR